MKHQLGNYAPQHPVRLHRDQSKVTHYYSLINTLVIRTNRMTTLQGKSSHKPYIMNTLHDLAWEPTLVSPGTEHCVLHLAHMLANLSRQTPILFAEGSP
jgi:hypothetical protein